MYFKCHRLMRKDGCEGEREETLSHLQRDMGICQAMLLLVKISSINYSVEVPCLFALFVAYSIGKNKANTRGRSIEQ